MVGFMILSLELGKLGIYPPKPKYNWGLRSGITGLVSMMGRLLDDGQCGW